MTNIEGSVALRAADDSQPNDVRACIRLVAAVVLQALRDVDPSQRRFRGTKDKEEGEEDGEEKASGNEGKRIRDGARRWFMSDETAPWTFLWCCDILDLRPEGIRSMLNTRNLYSELRKRVENQKKTRAQQRRLNMLNSRETAPRSAEDA